MTNTANKLMLCPSKDQFILRNADIIVTIIDASDLSKNDTVLEIGAGTGVLTRALAKHAGLVISFEIDEKFRPYLSDLPANVDLRFEDAWPYLQLGGKRYKTREFNKVVSNLPYSMCEPVLHNLTFVIYDRVILLVPKKFIQKILNGPIFSSFFIPHKIVDVDRKDFEPIPKTDSVVINLEHVADPLATRKLPLFLRQYIYQHEDQKVKNSIREGLISYYEKTENVTLTKNTVRRLLDGIDIDPQILDKQPDTPTPYEEVTRTFTHWKLPL